MVSIDELNIEQLIILNRALEQGIDIRDLCDSRFKSGSLKLLISARKQGLNISFVINPELPEENLKLLLDCIRDKIDIYDLVNPLLSVSQLKILIDARRSGINIDGIANHYIIPEIMSILILYKKDGYELKGIDQDLTFNYLSELLKHNKDLYPYLKPVEIYQDKMIHELQTYFNRYNEINDTQKLFLVRKNPSLKNL